MILPKSLDKCTADEAFKHEFDILLRQNANGADDRPILAKLAKLQPPPNNMGATPPLTPLIFSHGEKKGVEVAPKTSLDWLAFTTLQPIEAILIALQVIWPDMTYSSSKGGMKGYPKCKAIILGEVQFGLLGYDAKHGRNSVSLTGTACKTIITPERYEFVYEILKVLDARLTRVDVCFDFFRGEVTYDYALFAYQNGQFKAKNAPGDPQTKEVCSKGDRGQNLGRTLYIGPRDGEKFGRVYEKGLEVFAKLPEEYRESCTEREAEKLGDGPLTTIADDWLRLEVEFKRKHKDRPIPLEIVFERDEHFAGAYPFFAWALGMGEGKGRGNLKSDSEMQHDKLIMAHRTSYGNHVHSLRRIGFTDKEIVDLLDTGVHNQRLLKSGLVVIEQQAIQKFRDEFDIPF